MALLMRCCCPRRQAPVDSPVLVSNGAAPYVLHSHRAQPAAAYPAGVAYGVPVNPVNPRTNSEFTRDFYSHPV